MATAIVAGECRNFRCPGRLDASRAAIPSPPLPRLPSYEKTCQSLRPWLFRQPGSFLVHFAPSRRPSERLERGWMPGLCHIQQVVFSRCSSGRAAYSPSAVCRGFGTVLLGSATRRTRFFRRPRRKSPPSSPVASPTRQPQSGRPPVAHKLLSLPRGRDRCHVPMPSNSALRELGRRRRGKVRRRETSYIVTRVSRSPSRS
jgi:hypothetical protein